MFVLIGPYNFIKLSSLYDLPTYVEKGIHRFITLLVDQFQSKIFYGLPDCFYNPIYSLIK